MKAISVGGNSNIAFLPGFQASRLCQGDNTLWKPNRNKDVKKLYMDQFGQSVNTDIYTKDVIDEVPGVGKNIYKKFLGFLSDLKQEGDDQ